MDIAFMSPRNVSSLWTLSYESGLCPVNFTVSYGRDDGHHSEIVWFGTTPGTAWETLLRLERQCNGQVRHFPHKKLTWVCFLAPHMISQASPGVALLESH